jgi:hypothetical protein
VRHNSPVRHAEFPASHWTCQWHTKGGMTGLCPPRMSKGTSCTCVYVYLFIYVLDLCNDAFYSKDCLALSNR